MAAGAALAADVSPEFAVHPGLQWRLFPALLAVSVDPDTEPLQWRDGRPWLGCGPGSEVRVDGQPLVATRAVPDRPFELEWRARGCQPFGAGGPVLEGSVRYWVAREDWGFSAWLAVTDGAALIDDRGTWRLVPGPAPVPLAGPDASAEGDSPACGAAPGPQ